MKNNYDFEKILEAVTKLSDLKFKLENDLNFTQKELIRQQLLNSIVLHETKIPLEAILDVLKLSPMRLKHDYIINLDTAFSIVKFNIELITYLLSFLSSEFDPNFSLETEFDITELMFTALCSMYSKFQKKNVNISTRFYTIPILVKADKYKLYCILLNLLDNALKFSKENDEIVLTMILDNKKLKIEFLDHSGGFDNNTIENYFLDNKLTIDLEKYEPKSGLIIVYKFLKEINGELELENKPNEGAALILSVPIADSFDATLLNDAEYEILNFSEKLLKSFEADKNVDGAIKISNKNANSKQIFKIAIIDEGQEISMEFEKNLSQINEQFNCNITLFNIQPSKTILEELINLNPSIIFLEPILKTYDGFELISKIKSTFELMSIPIIVVSKIKCKVKVLKLGANEYFNKPITGHQIIELIKNHLFNTEF